jgi:asparagine synthase (glutamine-hydrolysing)
MAAILGHTRLSGGGDAGCWQIALDRMTSRAGSSSILHFGADPRFAFRGSNPSGFAESESWTVMADGFLDDIPGGETAAGTAENLLRTIQQGGIESVFRRRGSFALAAIDRRDSTVYLIRDRFGNRPLHYAEAGGGWCWASEIKCLLPMLSSTALDGSSLSEIFHYRWLAGPRTLLEGVRQVLPGHAVTLQNGQPPVVKSYWRAQVESGETGARLETCVDEAGDVLSAYLRGLARQFPRVAIPLSAGVDSALLAALACRAGFAEVLTISARYPDWDNPEQAPAAATARHLKLEHLVVDIGPSFIASQFQPLLWRLEEPARHYHIFPLFHILHTAASRADLVLYGEGADTVFGSGGAQRMELFARRQKKLRFIPGPLRRLLGTVARGVDMGRAKYLADLLLQTDRSYLFNLCSIKSHTRPEELIPGVDPEVRPSAETLETFFRDANDIASQLQMLNLYTEVKCHLETMDRMCASTGLEVAVPFLSAPVMEVAAKIPTSLKANCRISKPILRELGARYFPREWMYRPKFGFDTPTEAWLRGPLLPYVKALLEPRTRKRGLYREKVLERIKLDGDWELLWTACCLETLMRMFVDGESPN